MKLSADRSIAPESKIAKPWTAFQSENALIQEYRGTALQVYTSQPSTTHGHPMGLSCALSSVTARTQPYVLPLCKGTAERRLPEVRHGPLPGRYQNPSDRRLVCTCGTDFRRRTHTWGFGPPLN